MSDNIIMTEPDFVTVAVGTNPLNLSQQQIKLAIQLLQKKFKDTPAAKDDFGSVSIVIEKHQYSLEVLSSLLEEEQQNAK